MRLSKKAPPMTDTPHGFPGTLRDWFAGMALLSQFSNQKWMDEFAKESHKSGFGINIPSIAKTSYFIADAMMKERDNDHTR